MLLFLTFLRTKWRWLVFPAVAIFGVLLITQAVEYVQRRQLDQQQAAAAERAQASQQAGQAAHGQYRLDSTRLAVRAEDRIFMFEIPCRSQNTP